MASNINKIDLESEDSKILHFGLIISTLICIGILFYIPQLRDGFTWIFTNKFDIVNLNYSIGTIAVRGTFERVLSSLFVFIFNIIRYIIPIYLLKITYNKLGNSKLGYILSLIICLTPFMIFTESNIQPFLGLIINVAVMTRMYPNKSKNIKMMFVVLGIVSLFSIAMSKLLILGDMRGISGIDTLGLTLNAYFPGVGNTAATLNIIDDNKINTLFYDLFSTIPFRYSIFPNIASKEVTLSSLFMIFNGVRGNIVPCISGSEYYLGFLLAPIVPAFLACFSLKMKINAETSHDYWKYFYYMFFSIRVALIPNLYSHISFINIVVNLFIPIYLFVVFMNLIKARKKRNLLIFRI